VDNVDNVHKCGSVRIAAARLPRPNWVVSREGREGHAKIAKGDLFPPSGAMD
jgi:hypothetical protein